jgi:hypothetical protein
LGLTRSQTLRYASALMTSTVGARHHLAHHHVGLAMVCA